MPLERLAILTAVQSAKRADHNNSGGTNGTSESDAAGGGNKALHGYNNIANGGNGRSSNGSDTDLDGSVNVLLGGAMMSGVIIFVLLLCYCCHRSVRKHRPQEYSRYWRAEPDIDTLRVFTTHSMLCQGPETAAGATNPDEETVSLPSCPSSIGPPPTYDSLIFDPRDQHRGGDDSMLSLASDKKQTENLSPRETVVSKSSSESELATTSTELAAASSKENNNEGLPSYEVALKLEANGYV